MMTEDFPALDDHMSSCKTCYFGKQSRKPFLKVTWRATRKLQLIHTDNVRPQRTPLNGSLYYVVFIDDYYHIYWIFFLNHKLEVAQVFWNF